MSSYPIRYNRPPLPTLPPEIWDRILMYRDRMLRHDRLQRNRARLDAAMRRTGQWIPRSDSNMAARVEHDAWRLRRMHRLRRRRTPPNAMDRALLNAFIRPRRRR